MKGISIPIALLLLLIMLVVLMVPAFILFNQIGVYSSQGQVQGNIYLQQQAYQNNQVYRGNPNIYYNSSSSPYLLFTFNSNPQPFNITQIYYFDQTKWVPLLPYSIIIAGNTKYPLPPKVFNSPITIVTALGNVYFLNPNTSLTTVLVSGSSGKVPVYVSAYMINGSKLIPLSIYVLLTSSSGSSTIAVSGITPQIFYITPGTYLLDDKNGSPIYYNGLTGKFLYWSIIGYGSLTSPNKIATQFTVFGPLVLIVVYNASLIKFPVTIIPNGIPLGNMVSMPNGVTLTSTNNTIPVLIDNILYYISSKGITLNLTGGYHIIQFPQKVNITFNYTQGNFNMPYGQINTYSFGFLQSNTNKISVLSTNQIYVNGSGNVYGNFAPSQTYYLVMVKNNFYLPSGVILIKNTSPILGNIAGQLLQLNNTYIWGPTQNYQPFYIYVKAGSKYTVTYDTLLQSPVGRYMLSNGLFTSTYKSLLSYPQYVILVTPTGQQYLGSGTTPYGTFTVNSPVIIINYEMWKYGGN